MAKAKAKKLEQKRAELAHQWEDREGNARPTPERRAHGSMRLIDGEDAGVRYAYDDHSTPLRDAHAHGKLKAYHVTVGERFEQLCRANMGSPGPRSCLDWTPAGRDDSVTEYAIHARAVWIEACHALGLETSYILMSVCYWHEGTGPRRKDARRWVRLVSGLDTLADLWGIARDSA